MRFGQQAHVLTAKKAVNSGGRILPADHSLDQQSADEPVGGWVTGPELIDTEVLIVQLCRYTGTALNDQGCLHRLLKRHPDEECRTYFVSAKALREGQVDLAALDLEALPSEVRSNTMGGTRAATDD